ncbi:unnamed protein product [Protopolystoma xenopodis]|uniref:Uncharacterized protein n=1 Tax=Protopolystoma xenopodis TaxID=117903 RepID=A0A3S5B4D6_9PLAT|nr:unnamed protein product [Protopolystoma xenopodis]
MEFPSTDEIQGGIDARDVCEDDTVLWTEKWMEIKSLPYGIMASCYLATFVSIRSITSAWVLDAFKCKLGGFSNYESSGGDPRAASNWGGSTDRHPISRFGRLWSREKQNLDTERASF